MKILYVEDEIAHVELTQRTLEDNLQEGFVLYHAESLQDALKILETEPDIDLVLTDLRLPDGSGLDLLKRVKELPSSPAVVLVTGQGDQEVAVAALKAGAADYLVKQSDYLHRLPVVISNAVAQNRLAREQAALRQMEIKYQTLIEQTPAVVFLESIKEEETILYISPRIHELLGYTPEEWIAEKFIWRKLLHPDDREFAMEANQTAIEREESFQLEYRLIHRDGRSIWIKEDTNLIRDKDGKPLYWQGILIDITKEKEDEAALKTERDFALQVLNNMGQGLTVTGADRNFEYVNPAYAKIIGRSPEELIGRLPSDFARESDTETLIAQREERTKGVISSYEINLIHKEGYEVPVTITGVPRWKDGEIIGSIAVITDLTLQKQNEQALERQIKELTALHAVATAEAESLYEDEIIKKVTVVISQIYSEVCGILLLDGTGTTLTPHPSYIGANISNWQNGYPITDGISGRSVSTGKIIRTGNITKEPGYIEIAAGVMSELCVPIRVYERVIGAINVESRSSDFFTEHDEDFLSTVASGLGTSLERLRLFDEEQKRGNEFAALYSTTSKLTSKWDLQGLLDNVLNQAMELLNTTGGGIYLYNTSRGDLEVAVARGIVMHPGIRLQPGEGMAGQVALSQEPIIVDDYQTWANRSEQYANLPIRAVLEVPMQYSGELIGVLAVLEGEESTRKFTEADARLLSLFAAQAASAIKSARLFEAEKKRRQEAETLRQAASIISFTLDPETVAKEILTALKQIIQYDSGSVFLHEGDRLRIAMAQGYPHSEQLKNLAFPADDDFFQLIQNTGQPLIIQDAQKDARFKHWGENDNIHGWMVVPLVSRGRVIGAITLDSEQIGIFDENTGNTAMAFAHQAAAAIDNARLYDETQRRLGELEIINRVSASLRLAQSVDEILSILLDEALLLVNTPHGSIWLYDHINEVLTQQVTRGADANLKIKSLKPNQGIVGHVFSSGEKYITPELKNDMLLFAGNKDSMTPGLSGICIPIKSTVGPMGVLLVAFEMGRQISGEINLLTILAEITGNAIHRAELFEQGQEQIRRLTTLRDIDSAIASSTDLRVTLNILMDHTLKHLKTNAMDIMLYHPELQSLTYLCSAGFNNPSPSRPLMRLGEGLAGQVVMKGRIEQVADLRTSNEIRRDPMLVREGFVTYFGIPLIVKGQIKGVFEIFHRTPFAPPAEWMQFLQTLAGQAAIAIDNAQLFEHLQRSNQEVTQAYDTTLEGWARALELRDRETEGHTRRVTELTMQLAHYMGISDDELINIYRGVLLHDIGKMGVPDQILRKTGPLIESEWAEMRKHPEYAFNLLAPIPYLRPALDIPYCHHEHWDGSGYPRGLRGEQIPLSARIFSIVDIWDALLSDRSYRKAWSEEKVVEYLKEISGNILDSKIVPVFLQMMGK